MPRAARMVIRGEPGVYHVMSRTCLNGFPFGDVEKDELLKYNTTVQQTVFC